MAGLMIICTLMMIGLDRAVAANKPDLQDYCLHESFNATCPRGHVIVMTTAVYGRMRSGRCITSDYGQVGCSTDVMSVFDDKCSGREKCVVPVRDLVDIRPCQKDFSNYMEASYQCVKLPEKNGACHKNQPPTILNTTSYLGLVSMTSPSFGTKACPWRLKVPQGQRVNLTFLDLGMKRYIKEGYLSTDCSTSLVIQENKIKSRDVEVCRGRNRVQHLFTSTTNDVTIYIDRLPAAIDGAHKSDFLLEYSAIGCPDLLPQPETWMQRKGDNLVVKCNHSQETWYLTCQATIWIGEIGNCSRGSSIPGADFNQLQGSGFPPHGIVLAIVVGILLGIAIGSTMLLSVHCVRRGRRQKLQKERENTMLMVSKDGASDDHTTSIYPHALCIHSPKLTERDRDNTYPALLRDVEVGLDRSKDCLGDYCSHHYCHHSGAMTPIHNLYHPDSHAHQDMIQTLSRLEPCGPGLLDLVNPAEQMDTVDIMPLQTFRGGVGYNKDNTIKSKDIQPGIRDFQTYGRAQPLRLQPPDRQGTEHSSARSEDNQGSSNDARTQEQNRENNRNEGHTGQRVPDRTRRMSENAMK